MTYTELSTGRELSSGILGCLDTWGTVGDWAFGRDERGVIGGCGGIGSTDSGSNSVSPSLILVFVSLKNSVIF